jgi:hypothetical protein
MFRSSKLPLLLVAGLLAGVAQAGDPISIGPMGGTATAAVADPLNPGIVLAGSDVAPLMASVDGGLSYVPHGDLTVAPRKLIAGASSGEFYALVGKQVFQTFDGGATWNPMSLLGTSTSDLRDLTIAGSVMLASDISNVYRSADAGLNWTTVFTGTVVQDVRFAPSNPNRAYVGTLNGVERSDDGGLTWANPGVDTTWAKAIAVSETDDDLLMVGGISGVMNISTDGGVTFSDASTGLPLTSSLFLDFVPGTSVLYAGMLTGIWVTVDLGQSWMSVNRGFGGVAPIPTQLAIQTTGQMVLATEGGLFHSPGPTGPWTQTGFPNVNLTVAAFASPGGRRLVGGDFGVYFADPGQQMAQSGFFFGFGGQTGALQVDSADPDRWIAGGVGAFIDNAQVRVLTNNGATVALAYEQFGGGEVTMLATHPTDPQQMLGGISPVGFGGNGIIRSTDGGNSWTEFAGSAGWGVTSIAYDRNDPNHAVAMLLDNSWAESFDAGATWTQRPAFAPTSVGIFLAIDPTDSNVWYRADDVNGMFRSDDAGNSWTPLAVTPGYESNVVLHPDFPGLMMVADGGGTVWRSFDYGTTLEIIAQFPGLTFGVALALDESDGTLLMATTGQSAWERPDAAPSVILSGGSAGTFVFEPRLLPGQTSPAVGNASWTLEADQLLGGAATLLHVGASDFNVPVYGGMLRTGLPTLALLGQSASGTSGVPGVGTASYPVPIPGDPVLAGLAIYSQLFELDPLSPGAIGLSDGLRTTLQ